jgi:hypothetical protein
MSINSVSSSQALYESLLKQAAAKSKTIDNSYALQTQTESGTEQVKPTTADIQALLSRLSGTQPSLLDFLNNDPASTGDSTDPFGSLDPFSSLDPMSSLDANSADSTSFDPISALLKAFSSSDSTSAGDTSSNDSLSSLWSSLGNNLSSSELSNLLEKAYSQSSQEAQAEIATGQIVDKKK